MQPKLDIDATKRLKGDWKFEIRHSGSERAGRYLAVFNPSQNNFSMGSLGSERFPLAMTSTCNSVAEAFEIIAEYFERHGCL